VSRVLSVLALAALPSCDFFEEWSDGTYLVYSIDGGGLQLGIKDEGSVHGRVAEDVVAIGFNKNYLIVAQKVSTGPDLQHYFIEKAKDSFSLNSDEIVVGPLNLDELVTAKEERGLPLFEEVFAENAQIEKINNLLSE
jgi:hypothetical protein